MAAPLRLGIVVWSLFGDRGGLERVGRNLAEAMLERGHAVTIIHEQPRAKQAAPSYPLPAGADLLGLRLDYSRKHFAEARQAVQARKLDILVAMFSWETLLWFPPLLAGSSTRLIVSEHNSPDRIISKWNAWERRCCLEAADGIHTLLRGFTPDYPESVQDRLRVIPNALHRSAPDAPPATRKERRTLLGVGRFADDAKQFSLLIAAFALLAERFPLWDLELCGDGASMGQYRKQIADGNLAGRTRLPGMVKDVEAHYRAADIFCIPSRVEGFGMVVPEAFQFALPVVGFTACPGVNELVKDGENGLLVDAMTPEALAAGLARLMEDAALRARLGEAGKASLAALAPERVYQEWDALLEEVMRPERSRIQALLASSEAPEKGNSPNPPGVGELLRRAHPYDRRAYLDWHENARRQGIVSPFTDKQIQGFRKKRRKMRISSLHGPLSLLGRWV